jgi:hypothetical protein
MEWQIFSASDNFMQIKGPPAPNSSGERFALAKPRYFRVF